MTSSLRIVKALRLKALAFLFILLIVSVADNLYVLSSEAVSLEKSVKSAASSEGTASKPPRLKE
jgi:hypothetical protein